MKKLILLPSVMILFLPLLTCTKSPDSASGDPCGTEVDKMYEMSTYLEEETLPWNNRTFNYYTEGNNRVFQVSSDVQGNVCIDQHIWYQLEGYMNADQTRTIQIRLSYRYGLFGVFGNTDVARVTTNPNGLIHYLTENTFGIKNAYEASPGVFYIYVEWVIENYLDYAVDLAYFKSKFKTCSLYYKFKYPKT